MLIELAISAASQAFGIFCMAIIAAATLLVLARSR